VRDAAAGAPGRTTVGAVVGAGAAALGWVGVTCGGATGRVGDGVGVGVGAGGDPRLSFGATGGKPLSDGPCTPGARPSSAGGRRKVDDGAGVGAGDSACCAAMGVAVPTAIIAIASGKAACHRPCPNFRTVIEMSAIPNC